MSLVPYFFCSPTTLYQSYSTTPLISTEISLFCLYNLRRSLPLCPSWRSSPFAPLPPVQIFLSSGSTFPTSSSLLTRRPAKASLTSLSHSLERPPALTPFPSPFLLSIIRRFPFLFVLLGHLRLSRTLLLPKSAVCFLKPLRFRCAFFFEGGVFNPQTFFTTPLTPQLLQLCCPRLFVVKRNAIGKGLVDFPPLIDDLPLLFCL